MKRLALTPLLVLAAVLASLVTAAPASAANHVINVSGYSPVPVGQPTVIQLDGVVAPAEEFWDASWIEVVAISGNVISACPADAGSAGGIAEGTGGVIIEIALLPYADAAGNFFNTVGFTPRAVGPVLICAYLYNEVGYTWDASGIRVEVVGSSGGGPPDGGSTGGSGGRPSPVNTRKPWVTRTGSRLTCHRGTWTNATSFYTYRWLLDGRLTSVAGPRVRAPLPRARGHRVSCRVVAYGPGGTKAAVDSRPLLLR